MIGNLYETPTLINNEEYPFDTFWFWLTPEKPIGCHMHFHKEIEIIYVTTGSMDIWLDGKKITLSHDQLIMIYPNEMHRIWLAGDKVCCYFGFKFDPSILYSIKQTVSEIKTLTPFCISPTNKQRVFNRNELSPDIRGLVETVVNEGQKREFGFTLAVKSKIIEIVLAIIRAWYNQGVLEGEEMPTGLAETIHHAQNYIMQNYADVNEQEIAQRCNMSYSYFSRSFKKLMCVSFSEYVNYVRMNEAQKMLVSSDMNVSEIAQALGFSSASHFIRKFKVNKGCTPNQFKKSYFQNE